MSGKTLKIRRSSSSSSGEFQSNGQSLSRQIEPHSVATANMRFETPSRGTECCNPVNGSRNSPSTGSPGLVLLEPKLGPASRFLAPSSIYTSQVRLRVICEVEDARRTAHAGKGLNAAPGCTLLITSRGSLFYSCINCRDGRIEGLDESPAVV